MRLILLMAAMIATGCATRIQVDYLSDPPGATLYEAGRPVGVTPMSVTYEPEASFKAGGCQRARGTSVTWASGAKAEIGYLELCNRTGWQQHYIFRRPDVPGRDVDMNYALQRQRNAIMQQQADALTIKALTPPPPPVAPIIYQPTMPQTINCTSRNVMGTVYTDCR